MAPKRKPISVLFIDRTGATIAPMAAALLRAYGSERFKAHVAGGDGMDPACAAELDKRKIAHDKLSTAPLATWQTPDQSVTIDIVIRLGAAVKNLPTGLYGVPARADWPIEDPADAATPEQMAWKARKACDQLADRIKTLVDAELPETRGELQGTLTAIGGRFAANN